MIPRYSLPEMATLFSDDAKFGAWLEVEILACEAWAKLGVIPERDAAEIRAKASFSTEAVLERERVTDHDVAAFVDVVQERVGGAAGEGAEPDRQVVDAHAVEEPEVLVDVGGGALDAPED